MSMSLRRRRRTSPSVVALCTAIAALLIVGIVVATPSLLGPLVGHSEGRPAPAAASAAGSASGASRGGSSPGSGGGSLDPRWSRVLAPLLERRAQAWRAGDARALLSVYVRGSAALRRDAEMLGDYRQRGLQVTGVRSHCVAVVLERQLPDQAVLVVVDTLGHAVAHDERGRAQPLPRDLPTRHRIRLLMTPDGWRIAAVTLA